MTLKWYLGALTFILSTSAIFLNLLIFKPVYRLAFSSKKSSVYIIALVNIINDLCLLAMIAFYLSFSIMANEYVLTGEIDSQLSVFIGGCWFCAWYIECLIQVVMAANRLVIITFQKYDVFTYRFTMLIFFIVVVCSAVTAFLDQKVFSCCVLVIDHQVLSFRFLTSEALGAEDSPYNYSNLVLMWYNLFSNFASSICYIIVFITIRIAGARVATNTSQDRNKQDVRYLIQFVSISIFYIFTWISFEILPHVVPGQVEWFVMVPLLVTLNSSSNSIIYLSVNPEVQKFVPIPWLRKRLFDYAPNSVEAHVISS